jgi:proteic killer suppression protein
MGIKTFSCKDTEAFWGGAWISRFQGFERTAMRKLQILNAATSLNDLGIIPGNRLEKLEGDRIGQHSIRINDQWRVCFVWNVPDAHSVEITDHYKT